MEVNGVELSYRTWGSGPPLLLLHGFFLSGDVWQPFVKDFAGAYRVIVPDLRGHGRSTNPSGRFTHRDSATDILGLLNHLGLDSVRAIGFSSGAMTLIHAATREPERIEALVLVGGTSYFAEPNREFQRSTSVDGFAPEVRTRLRELHRGGDAQVEALVRQFNEMALLYDDMNFTPPYLGKIASPTLIVHGDRDQLFPIEIAVEMYRAIPRAYLWIAPNGSHDLLFGFWAPAFPGHQAFSQTALDFLDAGWADR